MQLLGHDEHVADVDDAGTREALAPVGDSAERVQANIARMVAACDDLESFALAESW